MILHTRRLTHPPCCDIHCAKCVLVTSLKLSTIWRTNSGCPCWTHSADKVPAMRNNAMIRPQEMNEPLNIAFDRLTNVFLTMCSDDMTMLSCRQMFLYKFGYCFSSSVERVCISMATSDPRAGEGCNSSLTLSRLWRFSLLYMKSRHRIPAWFVTSSSDGGSYNFSPVKNIQYNVFIIVNKIIQFIM